MRYFIKLSYDGAEFCGWQLQPNALTVQECLETTLTTLLKERVQVIGAGRTDSKVNAIGYVAHFDYDKVIDTTAFGYKLNAILPRGIVIHSIGVVEDDLHARFSATRREYTYFLHRTKDPFIENRSYFCSWELDVDAMNEAAEWLLTQRDFASFCKAGADVKTTLCTLTEARWHQLSDDSWRFEITANRFLRNMVRAVVGTLVEVGRGRMSLDDFRKVIEGKQRTQAGESMPAKALFLEKVAY